MDNIPDTRFDLYTTINQYCFLYGAKQFSREDSLHFNFPIVAVVIGIGGIGGHVAEIIGSMKNAKVIYLFDDDKVEISNLNRTVFNYHHVGKLKVESISEIISNRNITVPIVAIPHRFNEDSIQDIIALDPYLMSPMTECHIFDCRDNDYNDHELQQKFAKNLGFRTEKTYYWRAAYNGFSMTLDGNSKEHPVWGVGGYTVTPSHSIPSRLVALLIVIYAFTINRSSKNLYDSGIPVTFNSLQIINAIVCWSGILNMKERASHSDIWMYELISKAINDPSEAINILGKINDEKNKLKLEIDNLKKQIENLKKGS
jgi:hypothetical protein